MTTLNMENCDRFAQKLLKTSVEFITGGFHNPLPPRALKITIFPGKGATPSCT